MRIGVYPPGKITVSGTGKAFLGCCCGEVIPCEWCFSHPTPRTFLASCADILPCPGVEFIEPFGSWWNPTEVLLTQQSACQWCAWTGINIIFGGGDEFPINLTVILNEWAGLICMNIPSFSGSPCPRGCMAGSSDVFYAGQGMPGGTWCDQQVGPYDSSLLESMCGMTPNYPVGYGGTVSLEPLP